MRIRLSTWACMVLAALVVGTLAGCSNKRAEESSSPADGPALNPPVQAVVEAEVPAAFADLSVVDPRAAIAQRICPVSGEPLGSMGTPLKATIEGRDIYLCCEACRDALLANPQEYLSKLDGP